MSPQTQGSNLFHWIFLYPNQVFASNGTQKSSSKFQVLETKSGLIVVLCYVFITTITQRNATQPRTNFHKREWLWICLATVLPVIINEPRAVQVVLSDHDLTSDHDVREWGTGNPWILCLGHSIYASVRGFFLPRTKLHFESQVNSMISAHLIPGLCTLLSDVPNQFEGSTKAYRRHISISTENRISRSVYGVLLEPKLALWSFAASSPHLNVASIHLRRWIERFKCIERLPAT